MTATRRRFLSLLAAPAIVRAASLMPIKPLLPTFWINIPPGIYGNEWQQMTPEQIHADIARIMMKSFEDELMYHGNVPLPYSDSPLFPPDIAEPALDRYANSIGWVKRGY